MLRNIGTTELLIIAGVLMLFFGPKKIPDLTRSLSQAGKEFGHGLRGESVEKKKKKEGYKKYLTDDLKGGDLDV